VPTLQDLTHGKLAIDEAALDEFCRRWKIAKLELFGSALRDDFDAESDIDLLVTYEPSAGWGLFQHAEIEEELGALIGRKVDLITRRAIEDSRNHIRRKMILDSAVGVYEAHPGQ
jgi:predicted nucleotidyltransferase